MDSSPPASPDVTVSIVSFNTRGLLRKCLASLQERQREGEITLEVIVVDNGSTDGSIMMVANEFPWVQTLQSDDNIGYGSANNLALAEAKGQFFLVLNSDTEVEPNALALMRDYLTAHEETGMVVPRLILPDGSTQASCARDPDLISVFWEQTYLNKIFPRNKVTGRYFMTHWDYNDTREVEQAAGACFFVRREAYRQINGFDPAYFMYFEDTDFCIRLRRAGWKIVYLPDAKVKHHLGGSSGKDWRTSAWMISCYNQSRYYYHFSNSFLQGWALKAMVLLGAALRLAAWAAVAFARPAKRDQVRLFWNVFCRTVRMRPNPERQP